MVVGKGEKERERHEGSHHGVLDVGEDQRMIGDGEVQSAVVGACGRRSSGGRKASRSTAEASWRSCECKERAGKVTNDPLVENRGAATH